MLAIKQIILFLFSFSLFVTSQVFAQNKAEISAAEQTFDFGIISEADGLASHVFTVSNTGTAPLVITRITASCGCTQPEWMKAPIEPGQAGEVKISYNPRGRPGPFHKSIAIHSNAGNGRLNLYVKGHVTPKTTLPVKTLSYPYRIGELKLQTKSILYNSIRPGEISEEKISVQNESEGSVRVRLGKTPNYLEVKISPEILPPGTTGEIKVSFNTDEAKRMGRVSTNIPLTVIQENAGKKNNTEGAVFVAANIIDNFSKLSAAEKAKAPVVTLSETSLDFGKLPEKGGGIIPFIGGSGKESETFTITNTGKSTLSVYSVTCDRTDLTISGGKKELKPGASAEYKVTIRSKDIKTKLETFINVVSNDPGSPVRLIKVTAEK